MAEQVNIGGEGTVFVGEDKTLYLELFLKSDPTVAVDMTSMVTVFDIRKTVTSPTAILSKTPVVVGVFDVVRADNMQRARVIFTDDDLNLFKAQTYVYTWKKMNADLETVLMWGDFTPQKASAP